MAVIAHHIEAHQARCAALLELFRQTAKHAEKHFREHGFDHYDTVVEAAQKMGEAAEGREAGEVSEKVLVAYGVSLMAELGSVVCGLAWSGYEFRPPAETSG